VTAVTLTQSAAVQCGHAPPRWRLCRRRDRDSFVARNREIDTCVARPDGAASVRDDRPTATPLRPQRQIDKNVDYAGAIDANVGLAATAAGPSPHPAAADASVHPTHSQHVALIGFSDGRDDDAVHAAGSALH
jgi:hypothetical protein